jgi:Uma2 family endonuclease
MQVLKTVPDLVMEVLAPTNTRNEMLGRWEDYRKVGVCECWLVSLETETVELFQIPAEEVSTNIGAIDGILHSELLKA